MVTAMAVNRRLSVVTKGQKPLPLVSDCECGKVKQFTLIFNINFLTVRIHLSYQKSQKEKLYLSIASIKRIFPYFNAFLVINVRALVITKKFNLKTKYSNI